MRILLIGRNGQIGSALERTLAPLGEVVATGRAELDLLDERAIRKTTRAVRPDVLVNTAGYAAVDRAESERDAAFALNATAVGVLAEEARELKALLVHYSTDYVFDGEKPAPYVESDVPAPLNVYGMSKFEGERAVTASGCRHLIFRTSWVYGPGGRNFVYAILAAAKTRPELRVVNDQRGAPTSSVAIAAAVARILSDASLMAKPDGVYHLSAAGETTWYEFAQAILAEKGLRTPVVPVSSAQYLAPARRPKNSLLDNGKLRATFGAVLADWRQGFRHVSSKINTL